MTIQRAYKTELKPNNVQRTKLLQHAGAARWVYNWGLATKERFYKAGAKVPRATELDKVLCNDYEAAGAPWMKDIPAQVRQQSLRDLDRAYQNFFRRCNKGSGKKGFPKFKSRKKGIGSFRVYSIVADTNFIRLPRIGRVRLKECGYIPAGKYNTPVEGRRIVSTTVSEHAGRWFVSVQVEEEVADPAPRPEKIVGVDFGIKVLATCSDGTTFENPKELKRNLRKLKRLQRACTRKPKGTANRKKAVARVATLHAHIADLRTHTLHHVSHVLTRKSSVIALEDLNVRGMMRNHKLAQAISDVGFAELRRQIEYKSDWRGAEVVVADRWEPSSKRCSACGAINADLTLKDRRWTCPCGSVHDRDFNAAVNLRNLAGSRPDNQNACGEGVSGVDLFASVTLREAGSGQAPLAISPVSPENRGTSPL